MWELFNKILKNRSSKKSHLEEEEYISQGEFYFFMKQMEEWLIETPLREDKEQLLNLVIDIVKRDLQVDLLTEILYREGFKTTNLVRSEFIPMDYIDENGNRQSLQREVEEKTISLSDVVTIVIPWKGNRFKDKLLRIQKSGFRYKEEDHSPAYYFKELNLCYVLQGNHSIASGIIQKNGEIKANVYSIEPLFKNVNIGIEKDGLYWVNSNNDQPLTKSLYGEKRKVFDFRVAVLYEMVRKKHLGLF